MSASKTLRCAIYTRKSTEEGLDQAFNSLDAQREACVAYIRSQAGEGWKLHPPPYDDGGFSGGNMERPALARLLQDIDDGRIDCVVVYKIDRLTRSLADFAKIVERFEKRGVTFVSVTQSFNTTTSMGRLTLNVLLSFAQFEREVTAERIRDKFASSKARGIFMGGNPPLGYDARDRKLVINEAEAKTVRHIFRRYLELRSVGELARELNASNIRTKAWVSSRGRHCGGISWYVGPLRYLLRNRVYVGLTLHKGKAYPGQHQPILDQALFDQVQAVLDGNSRKTHRQRTIESSSLLTGLIFDDRGNRMTPQWSLGRKRVRHTYYVSQAIIQHRRQEAGSLPRVPAIMVEEIAFRILRAAGIDGDAPNSAMRNSDNLEPGERSDLSTLIRTHLQRIVVTVGHAVVELKPGHAPLDKSVLPADASVRTLPACTEITIPGKLRNYGGARRIENWTKQDWTGQTARADSPLTLALVRAHRWREAIEHGTVKGIDDLAKEANLDRRRVRETLRLSTLAPDIQRAIIEGRHPANLTLERLIQIGPPLSWAEQRRLLGLAD